MSWVVGLPNDSYKPITNTAWFRDRLSKLQKGCTRLATESDKVYQLLTHGQWFSPGTPASSTTKTGRHDIAKILLKVALSTTNQTKPDATALLRQWIFILKRLLKINYTVCRCYSKTLKEMLFDHMYFVSVTRLIIMNILIKRKEKQKSTSLSDQFQIRVITNLPNTEHSSKGKGKAHK